MSYWISSLKTASQRNSFEFLGILLNLRMLTEPILSCIGRFCTLKSWVLSIMEALWFVSLIYNIVHLDDRLSSKRFIVVWLFWLMNLYNSMLRTLGNNSGRRRSERNRGRGTKIGEVFSRRASRKIFRSNTAIFAVDWFFIIVILVINDTCHADFRSVGLMRAGYFYSFVFSWSITFV